MASSSLSELIDTSPPALAARFGAKAVRQFHAGRDPYQAARLAASFAAQAEPALRPDLAVCSACGERRAVCCAAAFVDLPDGTTTFVAPRCAPCCGHPVVRVAIPVASGLSEGA